MKKHNVRYLHVGCGENILPKPFENLDITEREGVDHVTDASDLSKFKDETFDMVYASHVLEHYPRNEVKDVLSEWVRVTKIEGMVRISVPSFENAIKIYQDTGLIENIIGPIIGGQTYKYEFHYCIFDERSLKYLMEISGLTAVHPWLYQRTIHSDFWDFSQAETCGTQVSLNLEGRKRNPEALDKDTLWEKDWKKKEDVRYISQEELIDAFKTQKDEKGQSTR